ncbi:MAG: hypothetical protein H0W00_01330 [Chloroflexi bacterium]|nr:hypothetical protein [Chloroflexota bacterium]
MGSLSRHCPWPSSEPPFAAAQVSSVLLGALVAPLVWLVGRQAMARTGLPAARSNVVAVGSGLLAALHSVRS